MSSTGYVNAGPFSSFDALVGRGAGQAATPGTPDKVLLLYEQTWTKCQRPQNMAGEFMQESNWFRRRQHASKNA